MSSLSATEVRVLSRLLDRALALPPEQREAWLGALPEAQKALVPRLRERLAQVEQAKDAPAAPPPRLEPVNKPHSRHGERVGPYRLLQPLDKTEPQRLWQADRADGAGRRLVALWLPDEPMHGERQLASLPDHPHVARLQHVGIDEQGRPYRVMAWVEGVDLAEHVRRRRLGVLQRLNLLAQVCDALIEAHAQHVAHGDLRSANLRVGDDGHVTLLDWGQGTLLRPASLAADLAGLGRVLQILLPGGEGGADVAAILRRLQAGSGAERYPSVAALMEDLQRVLNHHPVPGAHATPLHRARLFVLRHRLLLGGAVVGVLLLAALAWGLVGQWQRGQRQAERSDRAQAFLAEQLPAAAAASEPGQRALHLQRALELARQGFAGEPVVRGQVLTELGVRFREVGQAEQAQNVLSEALTLLQGTARSDDAALQHARAQLALQLLQAGPERRSQALELARAAQASCSGSAAECDKAQAVARQVLTQAEGAKP